MTTRLRAALAATILLALRGTAWAIQEAVIKNAGIARVITDFAGPLRTNKIEANGVQLLQFPGAEFLIDLDYKGQVVSLVPGDFEVKGVETVKDGVELRTSLKLQCKKDDLPLVVYLRYHRDPVARYQQKSITIPPYDKAPGAIIRRVTLEDLALKSEYVPVSPVERPMEAGANLPDPKTRFSFGGASSFAAYDQKAAKGLFFFLTSPFGRESFSPRGLRMWEDLYVPLEKGHETGRATIGAVAGPPEIVFKRFREFLWEKYCFVRTNKAAPFDGDGALVAIGDPPLRDSGGWPVQSGKAFICVTDKIGERGPSISFPREAKEGYAARAALRDACRRAHAGTPNLGIGIPPSGESLGMRLHWLDTVDMILDGSSGPAKDLEYRRSRYLTGFVCPPFAFGRTFYLASETLRERFKPYFQVYQHVLDYPDGKNIDGEGHIVDNKGFIILHNPSTEPRRIAIPLDEPELELKGALKLFDWTDPASPVSLGAAKVGDKVEIEIAPSSTKIIGVNIPGA